MASQVSRRTPDAPCAMPNARLWIGSLALIALTACSGGGGGGGFLLTADFGDFSVSVNEECARAGDVLTVTIVLRDANDNPWQGGTVVMTVSGTGNTAQVPTEASGPNGTLVASLSSTKAEIKTISVQVNPTGEPKQVLTDPKTLLVEFLAGPAVAAETALVANPTTVVANNVDVSTVTVTVRDAFQNPVSNAAVSFAATGQQNTLTTVSPSTDANGQASATLASSLAESKDVMCVVSASEGTDGGPACTNATAPFQPIALTVGPIVFVAGPPEPGNSTVMANPTVVLADGMSITTITVSIADAFGNPIQTAPVTLTATGTNNVLTQPLPTGLSGMTTGTLASTTAEAKTIAATVDVGSGPVALTQMPVVTFVPGPISVANSSVTAVPLTVLANGMATSLITATVRDAFNNPIPNVPISLTATGTGNTLTPGGVSTGANGEVTATLASTVAEIKNVTALANSGMPGQVLIGTVGVTFVPTGPDPLLSIVTANPTIVVANGVSVSMITVTLRDASNNPVPNVPVNLTATGTNNTLTQPQPTNGQGVTTATLASTRAEAKTITAVATGSSGPVTLSQMPVVVFTPDTPCAPPSTASAAPLIVVADGVQMSTITVMVLDCFNNPVPGVTVSLTSSGTGNAIVQPTPTNNLGFATGTIASTVAEAKTITVILNPGLPNQLTIPTMPIVTFVPGAPCPGAPSSVTAAPLQVIANGMATSTVTVRVTDCFGNPIPGAAVQLVSTGTGNTLVQPGPTNAQGLTTGTIASTVAEMKTVSAVVNPGASQVMLTQTAMVEFIAGPACPGAPSSVLANPLTVVADGLAVSTLTATVRDCQGNPVKNTAILFSATGTGNTLLQPSFTNASGVAVATIASTVAEAKTIMVVVDPASPSMVMLNDQPIVTFIPGAPCAGAPSQVSANPATVIANGTSTSQINVIVRDCLGNPISGLTVTLTSNGTGNVFVQPVPTNALGQTSGTIASTVAELKTITATVTTTGGPLVLLQMPQVNFVVDPPCTGAPSSVTVTPGCFIANGIDTATVTAVVQTCLGVPIANVPIAFSFTGSNNTVNAAATTNAAGTATATIASTTAQSKTVTVSVTMGAQVFVLLSQPTVEFRQGITASSNSTVTAAPLVIVANGVTASTVTVTARDAFNNPVVGAQVTIAAAPSAGVTLTQPVLATNSLGQAFASLTSTVAGLKTITATVTDALHPCGPNPPVVLGQTVQVQFVPDVVCPSSSVTANPTVLPANGLAISTITVTLADCQGNPIPNHPVVLSATGTGNTIVQPVLTNSLGVTTGTISSTVPGAKNITAVAGTGAGQVTLLQMPVVTFTPPAALCPSAVLSTVVANPTLLTTAQTSTITVTIFDQFGVPIPGVSTLLQSNGINTLISPPLATTNGLGQAMFTCGSTAPAVINIRAGTVGTLACPAIELVQQAMLTFTGGDGAATGVFTRFGKDANDHSKSPSLSRDGSIVAFVSSANNLVRGDQLGFDDVFVAEVGTESLERISSGLHGEEANGPSRSPSVSADGRFIAFESEASNLVPNDTNGQSDVFLYDRLLRRLERVSVAASGVEALGASSRPKISGNGNFVVFQSTAPNLAIEDTNLQVDVFIRDLSLGVTQLVSLFEGVRATGESHRPSVSHDGRYVAFQSAALTNLGAESGHGEQILVRDRLTNRVVIASKNSGNTVANEPCREPTISGNGRFVAFLSRADNLVADDDNRQVDAFVRDLALGTTTRVSSSTTEDPRGQVTSCSLSDDGRFAVFSSLAGNLVQRDSNLRQDVFVRDLHRGTVRRVSELPGHFEASDYSSDGVVCGNGTMVAFLSAATNLVPGDRNNKVDLFLINRP